MTPPLTDAELLAYIERTPELKRLLNGLFPVGWCVRQEHAHLLHGPRDISIAFHAREQRVREEAAVAVWIDAMDYCRKIGISPSHKGELFRACKVIRALNKSTAPQLSTANVSTAPSPEGAGQGEAAEAVGLLQAVKKDLEDRAEDGVVELSSNVWQRLCDYLAKQGGK